MLNKKEVAVMRCIFGFCKQNNDSAIVTDKAIIDCCGKLRLDETQVDAILKQLEYDGYFENTKSERDGEIVNVVNLKQKGKAFEREMTQRRREIVNSMLWRVFYATLGALVTLLVGRLLAKL